MAAPDIPELTAEQEAAVLGWITRRIHEWLEQDSLEYCQTLARQVWELYCKFQSGAPELPFLARRLVLGYTQSQTLIRQTLEHGEALAQETLENINRCVRSEALIIVVEMATGT